MSVKILTAPRFLPDNADQAAEYIKQAKRMVCDTSEQLTDLACGLSYLVQTQDALGLTEQQANDIGELRNYITVAFEALNKTGARS